MVQQLKKLLVAILAAGLYLACMGPRAQEGGHTLPPFELNLLDGGTFSSAEATGRVTVLNFFATWCGPCKAEMPDLIRFYTHQDPARVRLVAIAAGDEHRLEIKGFVKQNNLPFPVALEGEMLLNQLGSSGLPTTVIVGPDGHIRKQIQGAITEEALTRLVAQALEVSAHPPSAGPAAPSSH